MRESSRTARAAAAVAAMALLGVVAAVALVNFGAYGTARHAVVDLQTAQYHRQAQGMYTKQARAMASGNSWGAMNSGRFIRLEETDGDGDAAEVPEVNGTNVNGTNGTNATEIEGFVPECNSPRGCDRAHYKPLPEDVQFECGGKVQADICYEANEACLRSAHASAHMMYRISPEEGTKARIQNECKCFISNGCRPSCNVGLYLRWATNTGINCPAHPPVYHRETGVYQYGDPNEAYVSPESYSFDYYPEYPNPAGACSSRAVLGLAKQVLIRGGGVAQATSTTPSGRSRPTRRSLPSECTRCPCSPRTSSVSPRNPRLCHANCVCMRDVPFQVFGVSSCCESARCCLACASDLCARTAAKDRHVITSGNYNPYGAMNTNDKDLQHILDIAHFKMADQTV
eukprot:2502404-Rhodomonas_salina.2